MFPTAGLTASQEGGKDADHQIEAGSGIDDRGSNSVRSDILEPVQVHQSGITLARLVEPGLLFEAPCVPISGQGAVDR